MDECWHEMDMIRDDGFWCICGKHMSGHEQEKYNINFSTWNGFGKLCEWAYKQNWYHQFLTTKSPDGFFIGNIIREYINPDRFADAVYDFLKDKP